nr:cilia- and flagella-associated protein 44 isoform X4 [Dromaius novaehollandiae]
MEAAPGKEDVPSSPGEQEGADEKPAEGAQADHSGVQESKTSLPKESLIAEEEEEELEQVESDVDQIHAEEDVEEQHDPEVRSEPEKRPEKVEKKISETFYYKYEDLYSRPFVTEDSGIPINLLTLEHSFGYDCMRTVNLLMMDSQTLLYIAGNHVVLLDLKTKSQSYLRSSSGGGIGVITAHPTKQYFAVGEKGKKPNLIIYEYPSLRPYRILRGGTEEAYVSADFNHSGTLLASVGSNPDYMLTIWDWKQEKIVLRSKAFSQDVYKVTFSPDNEEQLTTSGTGHIKFWKMALTFTGLKLQGALGRFGKTAVTDVIGYVELPDGKVISGAEWGNLLLWEGGLIKVELCRAGHKPCHSGPVSQLILDEGELVTVGKDGFVRVWDIETVDAADTVDETGLLEMEPMNELLVGKNVSLSFMAKVHDRGQPIWYAQDANGALWKLDLTFSNITRDPECLYTFHSGKIEAVSVSPVTYLMATTALDRSVRIYDFISKSQLSEIKFKQGGTALTWAPRVVNPKGGLIAVGFEDGVVRIIEVYDPKGLAIVAGRTNTGKAEMNLKQAFKPHTTAVTALAYERNGDVLATGSKDKTVFFFAVEDKYEPIGFICVPGPVQALQWSPPSHVKSTLLVLCENGFVLQVPAPHPEEEGPMSTYQIKNLPTQYFHFYSIKSRIKLEEEIARREKKKQEKEKAKLEWIKQQQEMGKQVEEEPEEEPEEEEPLPPLYIPEEPSPILCGFYSTPGKFWLSLGGYDSGFLYHCVFSSDEYHDNFENRQDEPFEVIHMEDTDDNPIHQISFCTSKLLMFCGMQNGALRVYPLREKDLSANTLKEYWSFSVHDNDYGQIQGICSSYDDRFLITCGGDGNIFAFNILSPEDVHKELKAKIPSPRSGLEKEKAAEDIEDPNAYSIEKAKQKKEYEQIMKKAEDKKSKKREELSALRHEFLSLLQKNQELPKHMQLHREQYEMDHRIFEELDRQTAQRIQLMQKEMAWEQEKHLTGLQKLQNRFRDSLEFDAVIVHAIQSNHKISTYRLLAISEKCYQDKQRSTWKKTVLKQEWKETEQRKILSKTEHMQRTTAARVVEGESEAEKLKKSEVRTVTTRLIANQREQIKRIVEKSDKVRAKIMKRKEEWEELYKNKPTDDYENPKDAQDIEEAQENMGDYKLKTAADYRVPEHKRMNAEKKMMQLASLEVLINALVINFDAELRFLRHMKLKLDVQMKCADLCHITWFEELLLLKNFEKHEDLLQGRVNTLLSEQKAMQMKDRKYEIAKLQDCEESLYATFQASLGENNKFARFLTKVLKKKIKRTKKKEVKREADKEDESEEESDEESSLESDEEDSGSEDEVFDDSVCPKNCDEALFQNTVQLREKRLDIEDALTEQKKVADNLRKEYDALAKKAKAVEASLDTAEGELEAFQREKQQRLNELHVVVPLKLHQVEYLVNGGIPSDFSQALVFTNQSLEYLQKRIVDLQNENIMQREIFKKARQQHKQLVQDKKEMETKIQRLEEKCNQLMMTKFGRLVDLEALQAHSVNTRLEELKVQMMEKEYVHSQELKEWEEKILDLQQQLMMLTKENTSKLQQLNQFCLEKQQLETKLDSLKNDLGAEFQGPRSTDTMEKDRLQSVFNCMAYETALLEEEITLLSRKDVRLREELALLSRKNGYLFLQPSPSQDSETPTETFPISTPERISSGQSAP